MWPVCSYTECDRFKRLIWSYTVARQNGRDDRRTDLFKIWPDMYAVGLSLGTSSLTMLRLNNSLPSNIHLPWFGSTNRLWQDTLGSNSIEASVADDSATTPPPTTVARGQACSREVSSYKMNDRIWGQPRWPLGYDFIQDGWGDMPSYKMAAVNHLIIKH